ncbi:histidine phosphatase family protein [Mycolicibacterium smegmatis]|uniref:histidine phosphatase family protein n=1 Tax=Mycolicibacterium smegmatis TaxID=1772 RepID=UPI001303811C|nr:histidine phosphatase family protein [Mycolicibacterium smegmatis]
MPVGYLVRHGRTALNAQGRLRGLADPPLDRIGEQQSSAAAAVLSVLPVHVVVSSPLRRAQHTAAVIAQIAGVPLAVDARLTDRDYGQWTGHRRSDVEREWGTVDAAPGVQPSTEVRERAMGALNEWADVVDHHPGRALVVVSHDAVIRPVLAHIDPDVGPVAAGEGTYQVLKRTNGQWSITALDQQPTTH